jgi:hypothetical protein
MMLDLPYVPYVAAPSTLPREQGEARACAHLNLMDGYGTKRSMVGLGPARCFQTYCLYTMLCSP